MKFENPPKQSRISFSLNFNSTNRKIIMKLDLESYESTVYVFEALPKCTQSIIPHFGAVKSSKPSFFSQNRADLIFKF